MQDPTSISLLQRLQHDVEATSWEFFSDFYGNFISRWLHQQGVAFADAEDIQQEVMTVVLRELPKFEHSGRSGAFRRWLRTVTANRAKEFWRSRDRQRADLAGSRIESLAEELADPISPMSKAWDLEHDRHVLQQLLKELADHFSASSMSAFHRVVLLQEEAHQVAEDLGISVNAVRIAQSRVLRLLRVKAAKVLHEESV